MSSDARPLQIRESEMPNHRMKRLLVAALVAMSFAPAAAEAQFGGLRRRLEKELGKAVGGETAQASAAPTFSDRVLEITDVRVEALVKGLRAEAAAAERERAEYAAIEAKEAAYQRAAEAHGACAEPYAKQLLRYTGVMMGLTLAAKREQSSGGVARATEDSIKAVTARVTKLRDEMAAKCGEGPDEPSFAAMNDRESIDPEAVGAKAAGLTGEQYAVLRERIAAYVQAGDGRTGSYVFTAGERAVIDRHAAALAAVRKQLLGD